MRFRYWYWILAADLWRVSFRCTGCAVSAIVGGGLDGVNGVQAFTK